MHRRLVAVSAWLVVLLFGIAPAAGEVPARPFDPAATAARLDALMIGIHGGLPELRAAEYLRFHEIEGGIADCMRAAGRRSYRKPAYVSFYRDFTESDFGYGNGRATPIDSLPAGERRFILNEMAYARLERAGVFGRTPSPENADALRKCAARFGGRSYIDYDPPPGVEQVGSLIEILEAVHRDADVRARMEEYRTCMRERYGYDVESRDEFLFAPKLNRRDAPVDGGPGPAAWRRGVAELTAMFAADADCRRPAYVAGMRVVAARLDGWEWQHRAELDAIRAVWRQRVEEAAKLPR